MAANDTLEMLSSAAGDTTQTVTVTGRDAAGSIATEVKTLNGTTVVSFTTTLERVLKMVMSATAVGTITVRRSASGPTVATLAIGETNSHISFQRSASEAGATTRYEKFFWKNTHATLTLQNAKVTLTADPDSKIKLALAATKDDSATVTNRKTSPGLTFVDDSVDQTVPGGTLEAASGIGTWIEQSLLANDTARRTTYTTKLAGDTV